MSKAAPQPDPPAVLQKYGITIGVTERSRFPDGRGGLFSLLHRLGPIAGADELEDVVNELLKGTGIQVLACVETTPKQ